MTGITYTRHEGQDAARRLDAFLAAYKEVYAEPPYNEGLRDVAEFIDHYQAHTQRPGMRLILATEGSNVVGFSYGYYLAPESRWWKNLQDVTLPDTETWEDGRRTFVILELAVRKAWRRQGIAETLHSHLLEGVSAQRATLTVRPEPEAAPARAAYRTWGYHCVGISHPWEDTPLYQCMLRELHPRSA